MADFSQPEFNTTQQLISDIIEGDSIVLKANSARNLFQNHILKQHFDEFSNDVLRNILPEITVIQQSIYQHNHELLVTNTAKTYIDADLLNELQQYIKMSVEMLKVILQLLSQISNKGVLDVEFYCFIPININNLICATFSYCKESQKTHRNYFENIKIYVDLFQMAQEIHQILLSSILSQFNFQMEIPTHQELMLEFLNGLSETGGILFGLNSKLMGTTWRCYGNLIKQYGSSLTNYQLIKPIMMLFGEISLTLQKAVQADLQDVQLYKICNFLLRVAATIIFTFWNECISQERSTRVFGLISNIYKITASASSENAKLCDLHVHVQLDTILVRFFIDPNVLKIKAMQEYDLCQGFIIIVKSVLHRAKLFNTRSVTCNTLKLFFLHLKSLQSQTKIDEFNVSQDYTIALVNFTTGILGISKEEYCDIEEVLLGYMLLEPSISSLFAGDLWISILSCCPPTLCFDTLSALANKCKRHSTREMRRGPCYNLRTFMRRCFALLPDALRMKWIETHNSEWHLNLWVLAGVGDAPPSSPRLEYLTQVVATNVLKRCEVQPMQLDDLQYTMDGLEVLSTMCASKDSLPGNIQHKLSAVLTKFLRPDDALLASEAYCDYLANSLLPCTVNFILNLRFDNAHLLQILTKLQAVIAKRSLAPERALASVIIAAIAKISPDEYNAFVYTIVGQLLDALKTPEASPFSATISTSATCATQAPAVFNLRNCNADEVESQIVNLYANTARVAFEGSCEWMKNLENVTGSNRADQKDRTPTSAPLPPQLRPQSPPSGLRETEENQNDREPKPKRIKLLKGHRSNQRYMPLQPVLTAQQHPADEVQDILDHMKDEVKQLQKLVRNGKWEQLTKENSQDLQQITNKLQQLLYRS